MDWKDATDWSSLPDVYVTKAECAEGMFWRIEACSVPMAIGPEVRLIRADVVQADSAALRADVERLRGALERIAAWNSFPASGRFWPNPDGTASDRQMSYASAFGSNGERDFMRNIARAALGASSPATPRGPIDWRDGPPPNGAEGNWLIEHGTQVEREWSVMHWDGYGSWYNTEFDGQRVEPHEILRHCPVTP